MYNTQISSNMKTISSKTKKAQSFLSQCVYSSITDIKKAYKKPSAEKVRAFNLCRTTALMEGTDFKIIGYNCNYFSVAWRIGNNLKVNTGRNVYLIVDAF